MNNGKGLALTAATLTTGLSAGLFAAFSYAIMPGLGRTDDATFVAAMQEINKAILNPLFALIFGGALILTLLAAALHRRSPALPWILAGLAFYVLVLGITMGISVPLNDDLEAQGNREDFESSWVRWNAARAFLGTAAFSCLAWAQRIPARRFASAGAR